MDKRNTILEELRELSPAVANILRKNVYTVPFGYFDNFTQKILFKIKQKEQPLPAGQTTPFSIPGDYFETLASKILDKARQQSGSDSFLDELKDIAPKLLSLRRDNVWSVPNGYFETLADKIVYLVTNNWSRSGSNELSEIATTVSTISSKASLTVPNNYFENLAEEILFRINHPHSSEVTTELEEVAPLLNKISRRPVFTVPAGYFENIKVSASAPVKTGKIVSFNRLSRAAKYAVAAVTAGIMITGSVLFINKEDNKQNSSNTAEVQPVYKPELVKDLTPQEIKEYLSSYDIPTDNAAPSTLKEEQIDLNSFLKKMSDQEIKQYLQENAEPSDVHFKEG